MGDPPDEPKLFVVYLGGDPTPGRLSEDHEVVVVVAWDLAGARRMARAKWGGSSRPHIDAVRTIGVVDGYRVRLERTEDDESADIDVTYEPADG
jgi:hypothetical protein